MMSDTYIAYAILLAAYIFVGPFLLLIFSDSSPSMTGSFRKDYSLAFQAFHIVCIAAICLGSAVLGLIWSLEVLLR